MVKKQYEEIVNGKKLQKRLTDKVKENTRNRTEDVESMFQEELWKERS